MSALTKPLPKYDNPSKTPVPMEISVLSPSQFSELSNSHEFVYSNNPKSSVETIFARFGHVSARAANQRTLLSVNIRIFSKDLSFHLEN